VTEARSYDGSVQAFEVYYNRL